MFWDTGRKEAVVFIRSASTVIPPTHSSKLCGTLQEPGLGKQAFGQNSGKKNDDEDPEGPEGQQVRRLGR